MKKTLILDAICFLLILLFVYTAASKILNYDNFIFTLERIPQLSRLATSISIGIPIIEITTAFFLIRRRYRRVGLYISFILMSVFTLYVGYILFIAPHVPCTCGGIIRQMSWTEHLIFNFLFMFLAMIGIRLYKQLNHSPITLPKVKLE